MKHFFLPALAALSLGAQAQSPVSISAAQYPATAASVESYVGAVATGVATPTLGPNQSWDYRSLNPNGLTAQDVYAPVVGTSPFAGTVRTYPFSLQLGPFSIAVRGHEGFSAVGFEQLGSVLARQAFPLGSITGGATDELVVPAQSVAVNRLILPLPLTSTTRVARLTRVVNQSQLTVAAFGLAGVPLTYVQRTLIVDSVAGWGTLRVPVAGNANGSAPQQVLLVRRREVQQDSFYLAGQPAPAFLLTALGQQQGAVGRSFSQAFARPGSSQPVLRLRYANGSFATPTGVSYSGEANLLLASRAARELAVGGLSAWPNPAAAGQPLSFALAEALPNQPLRLTLRDAQGRVVAAVPARNGEPLTLPRLPAGLYLAEAEAPNGARASRRVILNW